jgi:hypothetical protein
VYGCMDVDDVLFASIRSDPGVEVVWRDGRVEIEQSKGQRTLMGMMLKCSDATPSGRRGRSPKLD